MKRFFARKRFFALLTLLTLCASLCLGSASADTAYVAGDLNHDAATTAADAAVVLRAANGIVPLDAADSAAADVTGNMLVGGADASAILLLCCGRLSRFSDLPPASETSLLGEAHADKFSYLGVISTQNEYRSASVSVTIETVTAYDSVCYLADIYLRDVKSFATAFAGGKYAGGRKTTPALALENHAILAINGESYTEAKHGYIVQNGVWSRSTPNGEADLLVLSLDGEMRVFDGDALTTAEVDALSPYQVWSRGASLLDENGAALTSFHCNEQLYSRSARTAIGYYERGHYCFVVVDGTVNKSSRAISLKDFAKLMQTLGCKTAYNLAGGQSTVMATQTRVINTVRNNGRTTGDIVYLREP